jgi:hypothetical protein
MVDIAVAGSAILLWLLALTKARATIRCGSPSARWLLASLAFLALGISAVVPAVQSRLSASMGINQIQEPIARTAVVAAAFCAQLALTYTTRGQVPRTVHARRGAYASLTVGVMWLTFAQGPATHSAAFGSHPVADVSMTAYILVFLTYLAYAMASVMVGVWRLAQSSTGLLLKGSLIAIALGCGCCLAYVALKVWAISRFLAGAPVPRVVESAVGQSCVALGAVLVAAGAGAVRSRERAAEMQAWVRDWRRHRQLYRLWADLTAAAPAVALDPASGPWRDALRLSDMRLRLYRRLIELRDTWLVLRPFMDGAEGMERSPSQEPAAEQVAEDEVRRLRSALIAQREGQSPQPLPQAGLPPASSMDDELAWWCAVATQWGSAGTSRPVPHGASAS